MTDLPPTIAYASPTTGNCPLCNKRPTGKKRIYGHPVCKKCFNAFANRRQLAYLVDSLLFFVPAGILDVLVIRSLTRSGYHGLPLQAALFVVSAALTCVFLLKDGFTGQSPGKRLMRVQALDQTTGQPIGFGQSFKRNAILLLGQIPIVGGLAGLVVIVGIAVQVAKGYRWGDRFAKTRVIWTTYARLPVFGGDALACEKCGYDLNGNASGVCPECGTPLSPHNAARLGVAVPVAT